ncbi:type II secretion system F family protein [Marmoricola sp. RAF53]|uniref:type II secretion system F family protein n=1 Tax=Marmoricola sp. RAF53 TaxID=3233059 RepID=UPI003F97480A
MNRRLRRLGAAAVAVPFLLGTALLGSAYAADGEASIDHAEVAQGRLKLLVSVPGDTAVDLGTVKVTVGGTPTDATAVNADSTDEIARTTMLAIDTSQSMKGARIAAAERAALTYLDSVPDNVKVGIVTFDNGVAVRQEPSLDRAASKDVIGHLDLKVNTALYEGVETAVATVAREDGQRQVLVLSDGQDNTKKPLDPVISAIRKSGAKVDVVALEQGAAAPAPLVQMSEAGKGRVVSADAAALDQAFSSEADALARQVLVTATVPADQQRPDASVDVSLEAGGTEHSATAFVSVKDPAATAPGATAPTDTALVSSSTGPQVPQVVMYAAIAAIGLGAIGLLIGFTAKPRASRETTLSDQLQFYSANGSGGAGGPQVSSSTLAEQARQAAANVLSTNQSFEARITGKLEAAGMALKSSEWLLLHLGITFGAGTLGLLISGGNPIFMLLMLLLGAIGPWIYLSYKESQRLKAFDAGLADTLQLMSGSLSAGLSLAQSLDTIVREGSEPITSEFKRVIVESRLGVGLEDALDGVAVRMQSTDFKWVVMAIRIQREVGGNLAELLLNVAGTLREREYIRRHVRALSAEGRLSCWILGGLPPAFLVYLTVTRPDYVKPLYTSPIGIMMCIAMVVLLSVGIFWMSKVAKVEV